MKDILILGGSTGLGRGFAYEYSKDPNNRVTVVSRDINKLKKLQDELKDIIIHAKDLTNKGDLDFVCNIDCDILVNSAGMGRLGGFEDSTDEEDLTTIELNVKSLFYITKKFATKMSKKKAGTIVNICSTGSFLPMPKFSLYGATKAFCSSYTIAIAKELKEHNVYLMALCPGPTETNFLSSGDFDRLKKVVKSKHFIMQPNEVIRIAMRDIKKKRLISVPGFMNKVLYLSYKFLPISFTSSMAHRLYCKILKELK